MTVQPYQVQIIRPDGTRELAIYFATGSTHAYYTAAEFNPGCQISVIGRPPEWSGDDPL